ncbi:MAG: hypothetical protein AAF242_15650, partial [Bacteroidota bacterium]
MMNRKIILTLIGFAFAKLLAAQTDAFVKYEKVLATMEAMENISFQVKYQFFEDFSTAEPDLSMDMLIWKGVEASYVKYDVYEAYQDDQYYLLINHQAKEINVIQGDDLLEVQSIDIGEIGRA